MKIIQIGVLAILTMWVVQSARLALLAKKVNNLNNHGVTLVPKMTLYMMAIPFKTKQGFISTFFKVLTGQVHKTIEDVVGNHGAIIVKNDPTLFGTESVRVLYEFTSRHVIPYIVEVNEKSISAVKSGIQELVDNLPSTDATVDCEVVYEMAVNYSEISGIEPHLILTYCRDHLTNTHIELAMSHSK